MPINTEDGTVEEGAVEEKTTTEATDEPEDVVDMSDPVSTEEESPT